MRWARREGRMERVKLAESSNWSAVRGGRPDLGGFVSRCGLQSTSYPTYLARSARVSGCKGLPASRATSPSVTFCVLSLLSGIRSLGVVESRLVAFIPAQGSLDRRPPMQFMTTIALCCGQSSDMLRTVDGILFESRAMTQHRGFTRCQSAQHKGPIHSPDHLVTANFLSLQSQPPGLSFGLVGIVYNAMSHDFRHGA